MSKSKFTNQQFEELRSKGYSPVEIAQELGVNKSTISRRLRSMEKQTDHYKFYGTVKAEKKLNIRFDDIRAVRMILCDVRKDIKVVHKIIQENSKRKERYIALSQCMIRETDIDGRVLNLDNDGDKDIYECIMKEHQYFGKHGLLEYDKIILKAAELLKKILKRIDFLVSFDYGARAAQAVVDALIEEVDKVDKSLQNRFMQRITELYQEKEYKFGKNGYICN
jgi:predicted transcriptional regulator